VCISQLVNTQIYTLTFMRSFKFYKMLVQHMLRETNFSNQVKMAKPKTHAPINKKSLLYYVIHCIIFKIRRSKVLLFDRQKALGMVYEESNTFKDAKQLDVQEMIIYRPQHQLKETNNFQDRQL